MPQPSMTSVHVNRPLTQMSVAYIQSASNFIADRVFPIVPVAKQSDLYFKYKKAAWFRSMAQLRAPSTESAGGGWELDQDTYFAHKYAVHKDIDDDIRANEDTPLSMDRDATAWVTMQMLIHREAKFIAAVMGGSIWGTDLTGVASGPTANQFLQFNDDLADPVITVQSARLNVARRTGFMPNTMVIGPDVLLQLQNSPSILDRIKYTQRGVVTADLIASLFDVDRVFVPYAVENTTVEGTSTEESAASFNFMYGKAMWMGYVNPSPSILTPSAGYTFAWTGLSGAGAFGNRIKRMRMEPIQSDRIEAEMAYDIKVVASDVGVYFASAVA